MAEETIEQMNRLLDGNSSARGGERDMGAMMLFDPNDPKQNPNHPDYKPQTREDKAELRRMVGDPQMGATSDVEMQMITSAQQGLMAIDPQGAQDVVTGLEITKEKVKNGVPMTPAESSGVMSILEKLSNALGRIGGGGDTMTYMVDGNPVEMTEREMMSAKNAGMIVQDMGTYQVDDRMEKMTPDTYADRVARGEITPDQLMMESSGSTMTDAERAIQANAEFNRRAQEEQEMMFRMNNPPETSAVRPQLRSTQ